MILADLKKPFSITQIHWRVGRKTKDGTKAVPFAYIDARDVMVRLDEVCSMGGWQARYPFPGCCEVGIKVGIDKGTEWIYKANGAGITDIESDKGQYSDAFKRAAVLWGVGQYLYDLPNIWVPVGQYGFEDEIITQINSRYEAWVEKYFKEDK